MSNYTRPAVLLAALFAGRSTGHATAETGPGDAGAASDGSAWLTGDCTRHGFRGGGYGDIPRFARSTLRNRADAKDRKDDIGFRLVADGR